MRKKMMAVLLLGLVIVGGILPMVNEISCYITDIINFYQDEISTPNDGGGGGGWPNGGGGS